MMVMIGSLGCQTDCEQLKRSRRSELRTARHSVAIVAVVEGEGGVRTL